MPLKLRPPRKGKTPYWSVCGTYLGIRLDRSTKTSKRAVAAKLMSKWEREIERGSYALPGDPTFASAAANYMKAGGERTYLRKLLEHFGDRALKEIDQAAIDNAAFALYPNATAATRNRSVYTPCSAILRHAGARLDLHRPRGSGGNKQTAWLWPEEAHRIFEEAEKLDKEFAALLIVLCYTGCRLSEWLNMLIANVRLTESFAYLPDSKNDEPRPLYLPPLVVSTLANHPRGMDRDGRVFKFHKGGHIYSLLKTAAFRAGVNLPPRSAFHILSHTWATWMRRYGGLDTKGLVATGRWKDRKSADRYEHVVFSEEARQADLLPTPKIRQA